MTQWNGSYYVTLELNGRVWRQNANKPIPDGAKVIRVDNGMKRA